MLEQVKTKITQADLQSVDAQLEDHQYADVENGEIITYEYVVTALHLIIIQNIYDMLRPFVKQHQLGNVFMDGLRYILAGTPTDIQRTLQPDFSFLRAGRIPPDFDWSGDFTGAPDLAVEVASPGQSNTILLPKIARYLESGSEEAWLIYPWHKNLWQFRRDAEAPLLYTGDQVVDTTALFPGLTLVTSRLFITPG